MTEPSRELLTFGNVVFAERIRELCPTWEGAAASAIEHARLAVRLGVDELRHSNAPGSQALIGILLQAMNDLSDLVEDVASGRGRTAMRAARGLVESSVTALDVAGDDEIAQRWLDSSTAADALIGGLELPQRRLAGKTLRAYRHHTAKRAKSASRQFTDAMSRWGPRFRTGWHPRSFRARCEAHGLDDVYRFYRVASAPTHASAAGSMGLLREWTGGPTLRTGHAVASAPLAMLYGLDAAERVLIVVSSVSGLSFQDTFGSFAALGDAWPELYDAMRTLDAELWPIDPPVNRAVFVLYRPHVPIEFYEYLPDLHRVRRMRDSNITASDEQLSTIPAVRDSLDVPGAVGTVGVFIHEAKPSSPIPDSVPWSEPPAVDLEVEIHIQVDGSVRLLPPDDRPEG